MIIRSQDRKTLTNFTQVTDLSVVAGEKEFNVNCYYPFLINNYDYSKMCLGTYSTEEKAIKVLDMILNAIRNMAFVDGVTFQMPADEDVEV